MPTYEYLCKTCNNRFDKWQKMTDEPLSICPECGGPVRRVLHASGVIFKGSGFYITDHANNGNGARASANGDAHKSESSTDEKPKASESKTSENGTARADSGESKTSSAAAS